VLNLILLLMAGIVGGALNSLAGGGSFIVFPALLLAGVPPVAANATNTFAALPGYISGTLGFWKDVVAYRHLLLAYSMLAIVGGWVGAELLLKVSDRSFEQAVPWLMAVAVVLFAFGERISGFIHNGPAAGIGRMGAYGVLALICVYGGFFNAGMGILLLAGFALSGLNDLHAMNGLKLWVSVLVAVVASVRFGLGDQIAWQQGLAAFAGTLIGGYGAARLAHHIPVGRLRLGIIGYGALLTVIFFWRAYA